jgi:hypothetical protein
MDAIFLPTNSPRSYPKEWQKAGFASIMFPFSFSSNIPLGERLNSVL